VLYAQSHHADCHHAECHYAECHCAKYHCSECCYAKCPCALSVLSEFIYADCPMLRVIIQCHQLSVIAQIGIMLRTTMQCQCAESHFALSEVILDAKAILHVARQACNKFLKIMK
jgi:hypothetical protein